MIQRLQVLQSDRLLEVPPACLGTASLPEVAPKDLLAGAVASEDVAQLRQAVRTAQFWIALLEGERTDLGEEIAKHKKRHQASIRHAEARATELREAEGEKKRLLSEIKWLQQSRDQAICDRHLLREDQTRLTSQSKGDVASETARADASEAELKKIREEKAELEAQLVRVKVRSAETLQKVDSMEYLIEYYEDQLRALNPAFEPADLSTIGQWMKPSRLDDCEVESNCSGRDEKQSASEQKPHVKEIAKGITKIFKGGFKGLSKKKHKDHDAKDHDEPQMTPRDVIVTPRQPPASPRPSPRETAPRDAQLAPAPSPPPPALSARGGSGGSNLGASGSEAASPASAAAPSPESALSGAGTAAARGQDASPTSTGGAGSVVSTPARAKRRWELRMED